MCGQEFLIILGGSDELDRPLLLERVFHCFDSDGNGGKIPLGAFKNV